MTKIEQVIGGVAGDTTQQAVQLRMRAVGQNLVGNAGARLVVRDAAGLNPITLIVFTSNPSSGVLGGRILVASPEFDVLQPTAADFLMTNTIPASYLPAGRLTFEDSGGAILWSVAWGGAGYVGPTSGSTTNDADGDFGPPVAGALPSMSAQALLFTTPDPTGSASSTNNLADYGVTMGPATFTNNAGASKTVFVPFQADLFVTLTDSPDPVVGSQPLTYVIAVGNGGPNPASTTVSVIDTLPAGAALQSATGTGWTCAEVTGTVTCTRPTLAVGAAPSITLVVTAPLAGGIVADTVTVSASQADGRSENNSASETTAVNGAPGQADLAITNSDGGREGRWGYRLTYTIEVANNGPAFVGGATVTDDFPAGLSGVTWQCTASSGSTCPISGSGSIAASVTLLPGGTATFTATGKVVTGTPTPLVNTAAIDVPPGITDSNTGNNVAAESTTVGPIQFHTVTPCRVADTRDPPGPSGGPPLYTTGGGGGFREFPVTGLCGVPADARAVVINVAVVQPTAPGDLRLHVPDEPPQSSSTINFVAGAVRANNAVVSLGTRGTLRVVFAIDPAGPVSLATTHFLCDVSGYFR